MSKQIRAAICPAILALVVLLSCVASGSAADRKPNFLFLFTDDHR